MKALTRASFTALILTIITIGVACAEEAAEGATQVNMFSRIIASGPVEWVLLVLSVVGISVGLTRLFTIKQDVLMPEGLADDMHNIFAEGVTEEAYEEALNLVDGDESMLGQIFYAALDKRDFGFEAMQEAAETVGASEHNKYMSQINVLSLLANIGPMLGLLGTVWGMIGAFFTMATKSGGSVNPKDLSDTIGGAMITTATGLIIAIPMLVLFFFLRARINRSVLEAGVLTGEVLDYFRPPR